MTRKNNYATKTHLSILKKRAIHFMLLFMILGVNASFANQGRSSIPDSKVQATKNIEQSARTIKGNIRDNVTGETVYAASITIKGTTQAVPSDIDGNFTINVNSPDAILIISSVGFITQEVSTSGKETLSIILVEDTKLLDEVVVVAYGTQRRSSVTGAISTLKADNIKSITAPTVSSMLQGKVAGVVASQNSGKPGEEGKITIRGRGSISSSITPLWVVDGVVGGMTSDLNPNDVETMTILKDGSATALYGARGANGVIVVTTKKASLGASKIDISVKTGITVANKGKFEVMNASELYKYTEAAFNNSTTGEAYPWFTSALLQNDTDWWDVATQTALSQNYNIAHTSGTDKIRSYLSGDYYKEEGVIKGFDYDRFTVRNNLTYKINERLSIRTNMSGSYKTSNSAERSLYSSLTYLPWDTPYNSIGELKTGREGTTGVTEDGDMKNYWFGRDKSNYLYDLQYNWSKTRQIGVDGTLGFDFKIYDGLVFESTNSIGYRNYRSESYTDPRSLAGESLTGGINNNNTYHTNRYTNQLLRYAKKFKQVHDVNAFLGYEYSDTYKDNTDVTGHGIPVGGEVLGVSATPGEVKGNKETTKVQGYYFNTNYVYDDRYSAQFSFRRDGSSKFGVDTRYGNFFTVGAGWNMHNESFIKDIKLIDQLKLRASYGRTGNTPDGAFLHMGLYQINLNYNGRPAAFPLQKASRRLTWETAYTTNVGLDARLFDRLGISAEFYIKNTSGLLYAKPLSALSGYSYQWINEGKLKNTGIEVTISPEIIKTKDWNWSIDFNFAYNKNKIKELGGGKTKEPSGGSTIREVGYALGTYYMKEWGGVDPLDGTPQWYAVDDKGNKTIVKSEADATLVRLDKQQFPDFTGGIQTHLSYRDFTLSASFTFAAGFYINHTGRENYDNDGIEIQYNSMKLKNGWSRWEKKGDIATHPQVKSGGNNASNQLSSRYLERGDFFKMKTLSLGYNIPRQVLGNFGLKSARVALSGENIFTITEFSGVDPELGMYGEALGAGYSVPRRFSINFNLGF